MNARDARAFGTSALEQGALLPADARDLIVRSQAVPPGATDAAGDGWLATNVPVLVRGQARIIPLAWWGAADHGYNPYAEPAQITSFASHVQGAALHRAGPWSEMDLSADSDDSIGSYRAALRDAGATRADCWAYSDSLGVALVWAGSEAEGTRSLGLHLVPAGWVLSRLVGDPVDDVDVGWSWADVIALAGAGAV